MRKILSCVLCAVLFVTALPDIGYGATLAFVDIPAELTPGKQYVLNVTTPHGDLATLKLLDKAGNEYTMIEDFPMAKGDNAIPWDGSFVEKKNAPEGEYKLSLKMSEGKQIETKVYVAAAVPMLFDFSQSTYDLTSDPLTLTFHSNAVGLLMVDLARYDQVGTTPVTYKGVIAGRNTFQWDGLVGSKRLEPGTYALVLTLYTDKTGTSDPKQIFFAVQEEQGDAVAGASPLAPTDLKISNQQRAGAGTFAGATEEAQTLSPLQAVFRSATGKKANDAFDDTLSELKDLEISVAAAQQAGQGKISRPYSYYNEGTFWTMTPGELDDAAIWEVMMQPMVVVGNSGVAPSGHVYMMENPDGTGTKVAQIHGRTQGLNILSDVNEHGYVLVEAFSNYDATFLPRTTYEKEHAFELKQGYIDASLLSIVSVNQQMAFLIDKLTQRMYIFVNGKRVTELFISTGKIKDGNYAKETIAGEFMTIGKTGGFWSNGYYSDMGIRINGGTLIHEIPYEVDPDGKPNYRESLPYLGSKRSAGCVRVQREANEEGYNMKWIWDHVDANENYKVLIWSDENRSDTPTPWRLAPLDMKESN